MTNQGKQTINPEDLARRVGSVMISQDRVGNRLGMDLDEIRPGYARMAMKVTDDMINGHDICHGGFTFALADAACAYACNSHNQNALSQALNIVFLTPAVLGETLIAEARESARAGRTSTYDIKVVTQNNRVVAVAQAQCRAVKGQMLADGDAGLNRL
jgi:acyl-CoA thioesterase